MLCCILTLFSGCKEDEENPLRFYNSEYEVPMGGRRYLGLESGNGDYSLEIKEGYSVNVPLSKKSREKLCFT